MANSISRVGIVGAGQMGSGIIEVCAKAGSDVKVWEAKEEFLESGRARIEKSLDKAVSRGKLEQSARDEILGRISFTTKLEDFADRELVIEAIVENPEVKASVFSQLDEIVESDDAILASNTSSLPIQSIAAATKRPDRVMGLHFFNPVPVLPLVEHVVTLTTGDVQSERAYEYASEALGKTVIRAKDRSGFIVNALLVPYILGAIRMLQDGIATAEDIDAGMVNGCAHPMGPLTLADMVGLDTIKFIADAMFDEYKEPTYAAPPLLKRMVEAGHFGRKSGRGFYDYSK
ncbi:3-hydroxybutyryl-CoA dehydrogenase [Corynebacterium sp. MSK035]|uniref:3-hydroxybutyryl-CoA dehydrogenase n=1 Tax=Corynebacterium amycolatum TaxID=43765 RepID=A0AAW9SSP0_CORAY|nr:MULTISPECIES: 3-hydroxybutyryl-CoA dehydrogenase [Corynebacterium]MDK7236784.1 3-hydroxybutyryl-CoA dehydrogenase [Corynebacterium amycolatum]MDK7246507.1 3-hydroxybutyryl-CoA dehydrogenase [Corynebacterium amycolatum]MDK8810367.1 3-hydroxybutyryl-CoA dehydrogenase [Corynebacterium sp. MSK035]OFM51523.1 3-hydroxybutyryl-CoA dehydrogenase [Corynebacterium sp. HMSC064H12]OFQ03699.1 3-hydroxybutyryl-CoA dehydrogenase [Corynebacterium sp. HMSC070B05]